MEICFATTNAHKVEEITYSLKNYSLEVKQLRVKKLEIQAETVKEIAEASALQVLKDYKHSVIVEDTGLFIDTLNGFPGPYASYVYETIGVKGVIKLLEGVNNRRAKFQSAVAFCDLDEKVTCFIGECLGDISAKVRGDQGFGFDSIFIPYDGLGKTFGEMKLEEKILISHRFLAITKFANWYVKKVSEQ